MPVSGARPAQLVCRLLPSGSGCFCARVGQPPCRLAISVLCWLAAGPPQVLCLLSTGCAVTAKARPDPPALSNGILWLQCCGLGACWGGEKGERRRAEKRGLRVSEGRHEGYKEDMSSVGGVASGAWMGVFSVAFTARQTDIEKIRRETRDQTRQTPCQPTSSPGPREASGCVLVFPCPCPYSWYTRCEER